MQERLLKILLVEPPFYRLFKNTYALHRYPLALGYLGGEIVRNTHWDVKAYNADFQPEGEFIRISHLSGAGFHNYLANLNSLDSDIWKEIAAVIREYQPRVVGISAKSQTFKSAVNVAKLAKHVDEKTIVIVGGPHPSMVGKEVMQHPEIDYGIMGEGERTIVEMLQAIEDGRSLDDIRGTVYRKDGQYIENQRRELIEDLDALCFPHAFDDQILHDGSNYPGFAFKNIFAVRGCPYNCFFCGSRNIWSRKVRYRSPQSIVNEIRSLQARYHLNTIHFDDDTFGVRPSYLHALCQAIQEHCPGLSWSCELPVQLADEQNIACMKAAGCSAIQIGVESGNDAILSAIRKNTTVEAAMRACDMIVRHGISLEVFIIVGFPQDTEATLRDTIRLMKKIRCDKISYSIFTPYPGTEAFRYCVERGLIGNDFDVSLYNHQSPANNFCRSIPPERFRAIVAGVEKQIDRKNYRHRFKQMFRKDAVTKALTMPKRDLLKKVGRVITGRI